jgi:hypothetical protein
LNFSSPGSSFPLDELAALSTRGHLVIEEHPERPDAVIEAARNVVTEVRGLK